MDIRRNHRDMTAQQKQDLIQAILTLKNDTPSTLRPGQQNRYDDFVQVHQNAMGGPDALVPFPHRSPLFYAWHRIFLREFETELQSATENWNITLPYWDWSSGDDTPFTVDFLGENGSPMDNNRVQSGPFALASGQFEVRVHGPDGNDRGLRRAFADANGAGLPTPADITEALGKTPYWGGAESWESFSESMLHDRVHNWIGGSMSEPGSPNDPVFFLHHCNLDRLWQRWRTQHPDQSPHQPQRGAPGYDLSSRLTFQALDRLAPWPRTYTIRQTLDTLALGYIYL